MRKTKICLLLLIMMLLSIIIVGCKKEEKQPKETYIINIIDVDDEIIGIKKIETTKYLNLYEAINAEFEVAGSIGEYGAYITSINKSIVDSNWSLMLYVNGIEAMSSCDKIIPETNSVYEFRNICWAAIDYGYGTTMDETDVLLDKALYNYLKTAFKQTLENITTYTGSTYWEMLMLDMMKRNYFDENLTNITFKNELITSLNNVEINSLSGADFGKYYIHQLMVGTIPQEFNTKYLEEVHKLDSINAYVTPFMLIPYSRIQDNKSDDFINLMKTKIDKNITWGPTGDMWTLMCEALFLDRSNALYMNDYLLDWSKEYEYGNACDCCTVLMAASAIGLDVRDTKEVDTIKYNNQDLDYVQFIFNKYYDKELKIVKINENDTTLSMSSNQIYASLLAYKVLRKTNSVANILGPIK